MAPQGKPFRKSFRNTEMSGNNQSRNDQKETPHSKIFLAIQHSIDMIETNPQKSKIKEDTR